MFPTNVLTDNHMPVKWSPTNYDDTTGHVLVPLESDSSEYQELAVKVTGSFNNNIKSIKRVQNPFLYGQFLLKQEEYKIDGKDFVIKEIFHDTAEANVDSIVTNNFDWRLSYRAKFGKGVCFSPFPSYANRESYRKNGTNRAMIITDILVGTTEFGTSDQSLPIYGDTTVGNCLNVYVKFFDDEFYPKYVVYYESAPQEIRPRRRYF